jgi:hypothetical protein
VCVGVYGMIHGDGEECEERRVLCNMYIHIHIHIHTHIHTHTYIHTHIYTYNNRHNFIYIRLSCGEVESEGAGLRYERRGGGSFMVNMYRNNRHNYTPYTAYTH